MKLIFVHGREQAGKNPAELKQFWTDALNKGLQKTGRVLPADITIEFPFYGDLLQELTEEWQNPPEKLSTVTRRSGDISISEADQVEFLERYLKEIAQNLPLSDDENAQISEMDRRKRGPMNWEFVHWIAGLIDKKQSFGEYALRRQTLDVLLYLKESSVKSKVNEIVKNFFDDKPCVVVGHSLGSVVSYVLLRDNPHLNVKKFITVGSPLGSVTIGKLLVRKVMPKSVENGWFNAYDERDIVALNPLDRFHFNIDPEIVNKRDVKNHTENRHSIEGYLDDEVVAKEIFEALFG